MKLLQNRKHQPVEREPDKGAVKHMTILLRTKPAWRKVSPR
jgi:hypothetical protein